MKKLFTYLALLMVLWPPALCFSGGYARKSTLTWNYDKNVDMSNLAFRLYYYEDDKWNVLGETTELEFDVPYIYLKQEKTPVIVRCFYRDVPNIESNDSNTAVILLELPAEPEPPPSLPEPPPVEPPPEVDCNCIDFGVLYNSPPYEDLCGCGELPIWMDVKTYEILYDCSNQSNCYVSWQISPPPPEEEPPPVVEDPPPIEDPPPTVEPPPLEEPPPPAEEPLDLEEPLPPPPVENTTTPPVVELPPPPPV